MGPLHGDLCTFMIISCWILLIMTEFSNKTVEIIKTHVVCSMPPPPGNIVQFMG